MYGIRFDRKSGWRAGMKRIGRIRPGRDGDAIPSVDGVLSRDVFLGILRRERARASRNSHGFSVVAFRYPADDRRGRVTRDARFLRLLAEKVRLTDAVGILADDEIGVFLPETRTHGAGVFADRVRWIASSQWAVQADYKVFCYPDEYRDGWNDDDTRQLRFGFAAVPGSPDHGDGLFGAAAPSPAPTHPPPSPSPSLPEPGGVDAYLEQPLPAWKRGFDLVMASIGLVIAAPVMVVIALHIKLTSRGPALFKQDRVGYLGRSFKCFKFRTMHPDCDMSSHREHLKDLILSEQSMTKLDKRNDPRIIPFGGLLRMSGLDELPQLLNVIRGDMSLVGPRPCIPYEYDEYDAWHRLRAEMRPGLTGLWQVSGKNRTSFAEMIRYDIAYARRLSLWRDCLIVVRTIPAIAGQMLG